MIETITAFGFKNWNKKVSINLTGFSLESFELDLTRYQCNAVVYYVKAKMAEDLRDIDGKEYYMREFKKCVEKERSGRKRGPYIMQGSSVMKNY